MSDSPRNHRLFAGIALIGALMASCTAQYYRDGADREVYAMLEKRRAEIASQSAPFTIEPPGRTLRAELLEAGAASRPKVTVDLARALGVAAENSREYQSEKENVYLSALNVTLERYRLGYIPSLSGDATLSGTGEEAAEASGSLSAGLSKVLGTGASIVANIGIGLFRSLLSSDGWKSLPTTLEIAITQPLLRGSGSLIVLEPLTQSERNLVYSIRGFERFRHEFAVDVATRLYRILQDADVVANEKTNYDNLTLVRQRNEALKDAGRLSEVEVGQARQNELSARNRWVDAQQAYSSRLDEFKIFLGLPSEADLTVDAIELTKLQKDGLVEVQLSEAFAVEAARRNRYDYLSSQDRLIDAGRHARVAADALGFGLDLVANYDASSPEGQASRLDFKNAGWSLGLNIDFPIDRTPQRNSYRQALVALEAERRAASLATDNIRLQIRNAVRDLRLARDSYDIQTQAVALAERRVASAALFLEAGRSSTRDLLEAQEAHVAAKNALTRNLIEYTLARLSLYRDLGALRLGERGIEADVNIIEEAKTGKRLAMITPNE